MFIKLTNNSENFVGMPVILNCNGIISITPAEDGSSTSIFCAEFGTWRVKETLEEIYNQLNKQ